MNDLHPEIDLERVPRHVAIIMDGNGRWAVGRGLERNAGHREGIESVRENGKQPTKYQIVTQNDGSITISLKAGNGQEIAENGPFASDVEAQAIINESLELLISERVGNPW